MSHNYAFHRRLGWLRLCGSNNRAGSVCVSATKLPRAPDLIAFVRIAHERDSPRQGWLARS